MPRIYTRRPIEDRFWEKVAMTSDTECWSWTAMKDRDGYGHFQVEVGKAVGAHRMAWTLVNGEIPAGLTVCHHCDRPDCQNPNHMFLGSIADNMKDRNSKNRQARGERHYAARLTELQVQEIRELSNNGWTQRAIAAKFGVSKSHVGNIVAGRKWQELLERPGPEVVSISPSRRPDLLGQTRQIG